MCWICCWTIKKINNSISSAEIISVSRIRATIEQYHPGNMPDAISYAYGYSYSMDYKDCTLRNLLDKADHEMYLNKQAQKKKR
jgi:GGDEF domain-containing protein